MADAWGRSWGGTFIVWGAVEQQVVRSYGAPFADFNLFLLTTIDRADKINRDVLCRMPSSRIDINGESEP